MSRSIALLLMVTACGSTSSTPTPGSEVDGCDGASLLAGSADLSARGPWGVGARTVTVGGLTAEVWYPAPLAMTQSAPKVRYDIRQQLPASEAAKIPDEDNPWQTCDCVRDAPLDVGHGPYPAIIFVHGTASFRHQSLAIVTHWASRGFVVIAADHPGLKLGDLLGMACGMPAVQQNLQADIDAELAALASPSGELAFLAGRIDATRIAMAGHSAGANAAAEAGAKPNVQVVVSLAGNRRADAPQLRKNLFLAGLSDTVVSPGQSRTAWNASTTPRSFVSLTGAGHLAFSDLCDTKNTAGQDLLAIAEAKQVCGANLAGFLFDCDPARLEGQKGWDIINHASTASLEAILQCKAATDAASIKSAYPDVGEAVDMN